MDDSTETFTLESFVNKLATHTTIEGSVAGARCARVRGWEDIGRRVLAKSRRVPVPTFIYGPIAPEHREIDHDLQIDAAKHEILEIVRETGPINIFRLIVNPQSFGQSVENMYHLSCLFNDGVCSFSITDKGEPVVAAHAPPHDRAEQKGSGERQLVMEFDMGTWKHAIDVFEITEATIRDRATCSQ